MSYKARKARLRPQLKIPRSQPRITQGLKMLKIEIETRIYIKFLKGFQAKNRKILGRLNFARITRLTAERQGPRDANLTQLCPAIFPYSRTWRTMPRTLITPITIPRRTRSPMLSTRSSHLSALSPRACLQ